MTKKKATILDLFVPFLKEKQVWNDLMQIMQNVFENNVEVAIKKLSRLRHLTPDTDKDVLIKSILQLGYSESLDFLEETGTYIGLLNTLPIYYDYSGTQYFENFMSVLLNTTVEILYLYSHAKQHETSYHGFYHEPQGKMTYEGGDWFKTTHVEMWVGGENFLKWGYKLGDITLHDKLTALFDSQAPMNLVLEKVCYEILNSVELHIIINYAQEERFIYEKYPSNKEGFFIGGGPNMVKEREYRFFYDYSQKNEL